MKYRNTPFLFTLIISISILNGCATTGMPPSNEAAATAEAPVSAAATTEKQAEKKKPAKPGAEPECD